MTIATSTTALITALNAYGDDIKAHFDNQPYDMIAGYPGIPAAGAILARIPVARGIVLPINLTGSRANAEVAATAQTILIIKRNSTQIGTITFAAGQTIGTFSFTTEVTLVPGDILYVYNAASSDATLADISMAIVGSRGS